RGRAPAATSWWPWPWRPPGPPPQQRGGGPDHRGRAPRSDRARLARPDERTHELAVHHRRDGRRVDAFAIEELPGVLGAIHARGLDIDGLEAGLAELRAIFAVLECPGHASDPELDAAADHGRHLAADHHVRDGESAPRLEYPEGLGEHPVLVRRQIDDAVGDDDVH